VSTSRVDILLPSTCRRFDASHVLSLINSKRFCSGNAVINCVKEEACILNAF